MPALYVYIFFLLEKAFQKLTEVKKFDYLLGMSMWMLTEERKNELLRQRDNKVHELKVLKAKSNADLWTDDLNEFLDKLEEVEEKERKDEAGTISKDAKKAVVSWFIFDNHNINMLRIC